MQEEIWKPIKGFEGLYQISNFGRIISHPKTIICGLKKLKIKSKVITNTKSRKGYLRAKLGDKDNRKNFLVHRLVAIAFIENPNNKPFINHKDGNKINNRFDNLEWVTTKENNIHAIETGLRRCKGKYVVINHKPTNHG